MNPNLHEKALEIACRLYNDTLELREIIEWFCLDAGLTQPVQPATMRRDFESWHNQRADRLHAEITEKAAEFIADGFQDSPATYRAALLVVLAKCDETGWEAWQAANNLIRPVQPPIAQPAEACTWTEDDPTFTPGTYATACGELWSFIDGGPAENNFRFCHGCGKPVQTKDQP